jgi:release factor glutamine methyltransferase
VKLHELIGLSKERLSEIYDREEAAAIVRVWISDRFDVALSAVNSLPDTDLPDHQAELLSIDLDNLCKGVPVQQVTGVAWFCNLPFHVTKDVLIPRPETEELMYLLFEEMQDEPIKVLDVCTGSGCIAVALKNKFPQAHVSGCDISFDALMVAKGNAKKHNAEIDFLWTDVAEGIWEGLQQEKFDIIVSNPPYITSVEALSMHKNVLDNEPHIALFAPDDDPLIFYRQILIFSRDHLNDGGSVWFEVNKGFASEIARMMKGFGFVEVAVENDISGNPRFVSGFLPHYS